MKRSVMLRTKLAGPLDTIQMCRDIVEANFHAINCDDLKEDAQVDLLELQARIYTDLEILARNQEVPAQAAEVIRTDVGACIKWNPLPSRPLPWPDSRRSPVHNAIVRLSTWTNHRTLCARTTDAGDCNCGLQRALQELLGESATDYPEPSSADR